MTAQKPATPLPHLVVLNGGNGLFDVAQDRTFAHVATTHDEKTADAIAHACNAYPRLVEALRDMFAPPSGNPAADRVDNAKAWDRARTLLRDLGEAE